jgi:hypothetical protein
MIHSNHALDIAVKDETPLSKGSAICTRAGRITLRPVRPQSRAIFTQALEPPRQRLDAVNTFEVSRDEIGDHARGPSQPGRTRLRRRVSGETSHLVQQRLSVDGRPRHVARRTPQNPSCDGFGVQGDDWDKLETELAAQEMYDEGYCPDEFRSTSHD